LTQNEKKLLTTDIVQNVGVGKFSRVEIAYSLLIGAGKPGELDFTKESWDEPLDLYKINSVDLQEFEDICKIIVATTNNESS